MSSPDAVDPKPVEAKRPYESSLPPVEAPTGAFIMQLFLIPLAIVSIVVLLWLSFSWLAQAGRDDPKKLVDELRRGTDVSWQSAYTLAEILRSPDPRYDALRRDEKVAAELIALVEADTKHPLVGGNNEGDRQRIERRMFLCRALGAFTIPDAAPLLARLANEERDPMEVEVRLAALEGLATLARNVGSEELRKDDKVVEAVLEASRSVETNAAPQAADKESAYRPHAEVRAVAAFTLGVFGGEKAKKRLTIMLSDGYAAARYNAATGLCRQGDEAAVRVLKEMLSPYNPNADKDERYEADKDRKKVAVLVAGIQGSMTLAEENPQADLAPIIAALKKLASSPLEMKLMDGTTVPTIKSDRTKVRNMAAEAYRRLEARAK
jgi:NADH:ubiquinone oxidoreductase subunit 3 (subunit A)